MTRLPTVLYIDNSSDWTRIFTARLPPEIRILTAPSTDVARQQIYNMPQVTIIVIAGGGDVQALTLLAAEVRPHFHGPMIAGHYDPDINRALMDAGCTDMVREKIELSILVKRKLIDRLAPRHLPGRLEELRRHDLFKGTFDHPSTLLSALHHPSLPNCATSTSREDIAASPCSGQPSTSPRSHRQPSASFVAAPPR